MRLYSLTCHSIFQTKMRELWLSRGKHFAQLNHKTFPPRRGWNSVIFNAWDFKIAVKSQILVLFLWLVSSSRVSCVVTAQRWLGQVCKMSMQLFSSALGVICMSNEQKEWSSVHGAAKTWCKNEPTLALRVCFMSFVWEWGQKRRPSSLLYHNLEWERSFIIWCDSNCERRIWYIKLAGMLPGRVIWYLNSKHRLSGPFSTYTNIIHYS